MYLLKKYHDAGLSILGRKLNNAGGILGSYAFCRNHPPDLDSIMANREKIVVLTIC
jgi:hypothetical protein